MRSAFIHSKEFARFKAYEGYPWLFERSEVTYELCKKLHLLDHDWMRIYSAKPASTKDLLTFHTKEYIDLLKKANRGIVKEEWLRYGLGTSECPVYKGLYDYHALAAGATLLGAELIKTDKADIVFSPTGGFHHAGRDFASGFCYINDIVLAIKRLQRARRRVLYVDIDAHHGDQVQQAFYGTSKVMTLSFHEDSQTLFPFKGGTENEIGRGCGKGYTVNVPLPESTDDEQFLWAFDKVFPPVAQAFQPDLAVVVLGADVLFSDPLSHLQLTNNAVSKALVAIMQVSPKLLALGCGGYVLDNIARTWALAWAIMNGLEPREEDFVSFGGMFWGNGLPSLKDQPQFVPDAIKQQVEKEVQRVVSSLESNVFPILSIKA
jgi:acetoin utilization protein AcuC